ncbi:MAG TPA: hypothetical protein VF599_22160 [Pyrinomonadaceae bacterium]|jgi:hypothetical protein
MKSENMRQSKKNNREGERGAALVMVIMISFLLLVACAALLLESSMNTANVTDAVAEQQAYYAAESGIQSALNVLRGNTTPTEAIALNASPGAASEDSESGFLSYINPLRLIETTASAQASPSPTPSQLNSIDFRKAVTPVTSNLSSDSSTEARLSRWLAYSADYPDRITLGSSYTPERGMAYKVSLRDPDNTGNSIQYRTSGIIAPPTGCSIVIGSNNRSMICGSGVNTAIITYTPKATTTITAAAGAAAITDFGKFTIMTTGTGASITTKTRFIITVLMNSPYVAQKELRGWIEPGTISGSGAPTIRFFFDSQAFVVMGSQITLSGGTLIVPTPAEPTLAGYRITPNADPSGGETNVNGSMTPCEPMRVVVTAQGFGPRGAVKRLETIVQKNFFNGMSAPATLTLVGGSTGFDFNPGSSAVVTYSGDDIASTLFIPPIGTTNSANLADVQDSVDGLPPHPFNGRVVGSPSDVSGEMPYWLQSPANLDETVQNLKRLAISSGRYFASGVTPDGFGNSATSRGITFCDGNVSLSGSGGGIFVVTGQLTLHGDFDFKGLIIVTGAGGVARSGGGGGQLEGNVVVAPYDKNNLTNPFLTPRYDLSGGGNSTIRYNSSSLVNGMIAVSNFVQGVAEK